LNASAERQIKKMREVLFESVLRQDIAYFDKNKFGEINSALIK
jgi:ABC-type multidrug transport system fused ATPase/permease subunit